MLSTKIPASTRHRIGTLPWRTWVMGKVSAGRQNNTGGMDLKQDRDSKLNGNSVEGVV